MLKMERLVIAAAVVVVGASFQAPSSARAGFEDLGFDVGGVRVCLTISCAFKPDERPETRPCYEIHVENGKQYKTRCRAEKKVNRVDHRGGSREDHRDSGPRRVDHRDDGRVDHRDDGRVDHRKRVDHRR